MSGQAALTPKEADPWGYFFWRVLRVDESKSYQKTGVRKNRQRNLLGLTFPLAIILGLLGWTAFTRLANLPEFVFPSPGAVWQRFLISMADGSLLRHTFATVVEVLGGLLLGLISAAFLGYLLAKSELAERLLSPYIVASQSIPVVAIAPLLVIWFGSGKMSKVLISALIVFFPVLVNTVVGVRSVPDDLRDLMRSLRARPMQIFTKLEIPAALPMLLGGMKISATLSVIGSVVGEFIAADEGLGFLINVARGMYDTPMVFVAVFVLIAIALTLYSLVTLLEMRLLRWRSNRMQF
jgi:NitT/TauT family transport system permease protein